MSVQSNNEIAKPVASAPRSALGADDSDDELGVPEENEMTVAESQRRLQGTDSGAAIMMPEEDSDDASMGQQSEQQ